MPLFPAPANSFRTSFNSRRNIAPQRTDANVPQAAVSNRSNVAPLLDHLVGPQQERLRNRQAERLCGGQIDDESELGRLLDRQVPRPRPAQNLVDKIGGTPEQIWEVWSIGHQTS